MTGEVKEQYDKDGTIPEEYDDATRELAVNLYADLQPYTPYLLIFEKFDPDTDDYDDSVSSGDESSSSDTGALDHAEKFASLLGTSCILDTEFYVDASTVLRSNGEIVDPTIGVCVGGTIEITPETRYTVLDSDGNVETDSDGNVVKETIPGMLYDWYYGTVDDFIAVTDDISVQSALASFRDVYGKDEELPSSWDQTYSSTFSEAEYNVLAELVTEENLFLAMSSLPVTMPDMGIRLVIVPVVASAQMPEGANYEVCLSYVPLVLMPTAQAPTVYPGFTDVTYPYDAYPNVRLGKQQITEATTRGNTVDTTTPNLYINLREAAHGFSTSNTLEKSSDYPYLYLIDSDDPAWTERLHIDDLTNTDYAIGWINGFTASKTNTDRQDNYMQIRFYGGDDANPLYKFEPKEGYTYTCLVYFIDTGVNYNDIVVERVDWIEDETDYSGLACIGTMPITFKVVPENLVWTGDETDNWNNDSHWVRADHADLNLPDTDENYTSNKDNGTNNGFVPMLFTNVVMPKNSEVELYPAGFTNSNNVYSWSGDEVDYTTAGLDLSEHPTENIMYDMMVYNYDTENKMQTEMYRANLCGELHLSQGAHILHAEQLLANKVWTDVAIPQNSWTLVSSPLTGIVAGDWYVTTDATSQTALPLFTDITLASGYDRYDPAIYQRSWGADAKIIRSGSSSGETVPVYDGTGWTAVYNDAYYSYTPGEGYSIKGGYGSETNTGDLYFRFPKSDTSYTYADGNMPDGHSAGQLGIFDMTKRTESSIDNDMADAQEYTVSLSDSGVDGYYLIGNPFPAYLSMAAFMKENEHLAGYWAPDEAINGPVGGTAGTASTGYDNVYVKPYSAFFVQANSGTTTSTVTFTADMQALVDDTSSDITTFSIRAASPKGGSSAAIAYSDSADDEYALGEDVMLLTDPSWSNGQPMIYSVATTNAVAVNMLNEKEFIPIGVFADDDSDYTLTFVGTDKLNTPSLFDAELLTDTPLTEGYTLTLTGSTHGRYFLHAYGAAEGICDITAGDDDITVYSPTPHTLVVTASAEISSIEVYSLNGTALAEATPTSLTCTLAGLPTGVTIVRTTTPNATTTKKLYVR